MGGGVGFGGFLPGLYPGVGNRPAAYGPIGGLAMTAPSRMRAPPAMSRGSGMFFGGSPFDSPPMTPAFGMGPAAAAAVSSSSVGGGAFQMYPGGGPGSDDHSR